MSDRCFTLASSNAEMASSAAAWLAGRPETVVVAPTRAAADEFVRAACGAGFLGVHRTTLSQLAAELAAPAIAERGLAPVSGLGMEAVAARVTDRLRRERKLAYFDPVSDTPGFARALAATIGELRLEEIGAPDLAAAGLPGADLAQLAALYEEELHARALVDRPALLRLAIEVARAGRHRLIGLPLLLLDPRIENSRQRDLLAALVEHSPAVLALSLDADENAIGHLSEIVAAPAGSAVSAPSAPPDSATASAPPAGSAVSVPSTSPDSATASAPPAGSAVSVPSTSPDSATASAPPAGSAVSVPSTSPDSATPSAPPAGSAVSAPSAPRDSATASAPPASSASPAPPAPPDSAATLDRLRRLLFSADALPAGPPDDSVEFFSAPGEGLECVEIARRILRMAAHDLPFDRMAILLRSPERYQPLVEEALRRAAIPGYFSRGSTRPDAAGRAFLALLACAAEGCTASRFAEYLSLGQAPAEKIETAWVAPQADEFGDIAPSPEPPPQRAEKSGLPQFAWEKLLVDAAVVGGHDRWVRRLRGLEQELRLKLAELDGDEAQTARIERQLDTLLELERFALPLIELLAALPGRASWGEWIERLGAVAQVALRNPESVLAVLAELEPMGDVGPAGLDEVFGVLTDWLRFLRRDPPPRRYGQVFVGTIDEARARAFDIVFLPGLAEGLFPRRAFEDPLLLDIHRRNLRGSLTVQDDRVARERLLLRIAAAAARTRLVVSYPRMDAVEARPRVPSFYAMEVVRAAEGRLPDLRDFEKRAAQSAPARLGWPAPANSSEAVDDAEYDLATLGPWMTARPGEARGMGRYLLEVNGNLGRSLRTRWRRWAKAWSDADGIVNPDAAALAALAKYRLSSRAYSPSALQHFAACPYRFLLHAIHRLHPRDEAVALEQMDPLTRGSLFHAAQFELFRAIESGETGGGDIGEVADRVLERVAAAYAEKLAPAIPRVWASEVEDLKMDLRGWIRQLGGILAEWRPIFYEFSFGLPLGPEHDPRSVADEAVVLDGVRLRGSMDIVEKHQARGTLRITDHKTGKAPPEPPLYVGRGAYLQPLLYALAAAQIFPETVESGRLFYCTQRGGYQEFDLALSDTARAQVGRALGAIDGAIAAGFLPAAPQKDACRNCDYRPVCGPYEEQRARDKRSDARLDGLIELRRTP